MKNRRSKRLTLLMLLVAFGSLFLAACSPQGHSILTTVQKESHTLKDDGNVLPRKLEVPSDEMTKGLNLPKDVGWKTVVSGDCTCQTMKTNSRGDLLADQRVDCAGIKAGATQLYQVTQGMSADPNTPTQTCVMYFEIPEFQRTTTSTKK